MSDETRDNTPEEPPVEELAEFGLPADPGFSGRVERSLNRHLLVGDSLEFSLDIFQKTVWEYLKTAVEAWPARKQGPTE